MNSPAVPRDFESLAPAGYYIALRIGFAFPLEEVNALPAAWVERYTRAGHMLADPVMRWLYTNSGAIRWSEINLPDPQGVLEEAAEHGLRFGAAISCTGRGRDGQRSLGSFARSDREFTDDELRLLREVLQHLHDAKAPPTGLTDAELEALRMVRDGLLVKEIAARLNISEGAVKLRLRNARRKLGAKTGAHAASMAQAHGLI
jgi:LuxR family transcriptional regulator, quorum-sensing system regulator SdiA